MTPCQKQKALQDGREHARKIGEGGHWALHMRKAPLWCWYSDGRAGIMAKCKHYDLRKAKLEDSEAIHSLHVASCWSEQCLSMYSEEYTQNYVAALSAEQIHAPIINGEVWVAVNATPTAEEIVGFGSVYCDTAAGACEIMHLYVHPKWFGKGVGAKILSRLEQQARSMGYVSAKVGSGLNAIRFYEKQGYESTGQIEQRPTTDVHVLRKLL